MPPRPTTPKARRVPRAVARAAQANEGMPPQQELPSASFALEQSGRNTRIGRGDSWGGEIRFPELAHLSGLLPLAAKALSLPQEELHVCNSWAMPDAQDTTYRDRPVSFHGLTDTLPFIYRVRSHNPDFALGTGLVVFENSTDPSIRYARLSLGDFNVAILPKKKIFRLFRNIKRQIAASAKERGEVPPILADGMLDLVLQNTVNFLIRRKEIDKYGVKIRRGVILEGDPGNGKTMLCRYIQRLCQENDIEFGIITASDIDAAFSKGSLNELFNENEVAFFDDIDISYLDRNRGDSRRACSILSAMDGFDQSSHLIRIFTTNEDSSQIDPAFMRPGRIDLRVKLEKPTEDMRRRLLKRWPTSITANIEPEEVVRRSDEMSFAELESIRALLVTNAVFSGIGWDVDRAFKDYQHNREAHQRMGVGFSSGCKVASEGKEDGNL